MEKIIVETLSNTMNYHQYVAKVESLLQEGKTSTTDTGDNPDLVHYTELNLVRMRRLDKTTKLDASTLETLTKIDQPTTWLTITEGWCGDAAQIVPVLEKMATENAHIQHVLIFRDEHPTIMDNFLTDGGRSIPKTIVLDASGNVLGHWGPRPKALHDIVMGYKAKMLAMPSEERKAYFEMVKTDVQKWYNDDKTHSIQREFLATFTNFVAV